MKIDTALETFDVFENFVINNVLSGIIITFMFTRPLFILIAPLSIVC